MSKIELDEAGQRDAIEAFRELADLERDKRLKAEQEAELLREEVERLRDELGAALVRENNALAKRSRVGG